MIHFFLSVLIYFAPTIIAAVRHHPETDEIFVVNLLLGWTVILWLITLVWSVSPHK
jgi:hypothetical protein